VGGGGLRFVAASGVAAAGAGAVIEDGLPATGMNGRVRRVPAPLRGGLSKRAHKPKPTADPTLATQECAIRTGA
jgi:hypothetical protein